MTLSNKSKPPFSFRLSLISFLLLTAIGYSTIFILYYLMPPFFAGVFFGGPQNFPFSFQMAMWLPFFLGLHILYDRYAQYRDSQKHFKQVCIPSPESVILNVSDFSKILLVVKPHIKKSVALAPKVIHQVILKYQGSKSVEQASSMLSSLLDLAHQKLDLNYSSIRYLSWLIPTLGFMGTVYGISLTVSAVGSSSPDDPSLLATIASNLAVAFDTTLLALIQAAILIYITHVIESKEEGAINRLGEYVLEHIINRLE